MSPAQTSIASGSDAVVAAMVDKPVEGDSANNLTWWVLVAISALVVVAVFEPESSLAVPLSASGVLNYVCSPALRRVYKQKVH